MAKKMKLKNKILIIIFLVSILIIYFVNESSIFEVKEIKVDCANEELTTHIEKELSHIINTNIFDVDNKKIKELILKNKVVDDVKVNIEYPDRVNIDIEVENIMYQFKTKEGYYLIDDEYKVINRINKASNDYIMLDVDAHIKNNKLIIENRDVNNILSTIIKALKDSISNNELKTISIENEGEVELNIKGITVLLEKSSIEDKILYVENIVDDLLKKEEKEGILDMSSDRYEGIYIKK